MKNYGIGAIALMVGLGACAKNPDPTKMVNTPMVKYKTAKVKAAVKQVNNLIPLESSGDINIKNVKEYAKCGVNFISIGSLTHSVKSIDLSMLST